MALPDLAVMTDENELQQMVCDRAESKWHVRLAHGYSDRSQSVRKSFLSLLQKIGKSFKEFSPTVGALIYEHLRRKCKLDATIHASERKSAAFAVN